MSLLQPGSELTRYSLLGILATGGMSEIYLARTKGLSGFNKVVALKVILPHLAADEHFMAMFRNEAKLAALLSHPNVVQIFDYGEELNTHFMAMEYIDGRNLRRILAVHKKTGQRTLPREIALRIVSDTCSALEYAHELTDSDGAPLQIIHRDVSLENIIVTYQGQVKLVDFGIAKATFLENLTAEGTLKGKYSYMAPEIVKGEDLDNRIDIYSVGVVLYALLLGAMPFKAKNTAHLLASILNEDPRPPLQVDPTLPMALDAIIRRALHKDRDRRYQKVGELQEDLETYFAEHESMVRPLHLSKFMAATFPEGTDEDRATYQALTSTTPHSLPKESSSRSESSKLGLEPGLPAAAAPALPPSPALTRSQGLTGEASETSASGSAAELVELRPPSSITPTKVLIGAAVLVFVVGILITYGLLSQTSGPVHVAASALDGTVVAPPEVPITQPKVVTPQPKVVTPQPKAVTPQPKVVTPQPKVVTPQPKAVTPQPKVRPQPKVVTPKPRVRPKPKVVTPKPRVRPKLKLGHLSIVAPGPGLVYDGRRWIGTLPLRRAQLKPGVHKLRILSTKRGYTMYRRVTVVAGTHQQLNLNPGKGTINLLVHPWAKVTLDGRSLGITPLDPIKVYEGLHTLVLTNNKLGKRERRRIVVKAGRVVRVKVIFK
jgi:serine/threonine protein kinase